MNRLALACALTLGPSLAGCGETPPIIPRAGWTVAFQDTGIDCSIASHNAKMGDVTGTAKLRTLEDGEVEGTGTAAIECSVVGDAGGPFAIDATASIGDRFLSVIVQSLSLDATQAAPSKGAVAYQSVNTINPYASQPDALCDFYFTPEQDASPGFVFLSFTCAEVVSDQSICAIQQGYAAFENCLSASQ